MVGVMVRLRKIGTAFLACVVIAGGVANAQTKPASQGPLVLEPTTDGPVIVPEVKFGDFDGDTGTLLGGYGGWLFDNRLLLGGGASFLVDHDYYDPVGTMGYGGFVAAWTVPVGKVFNLGVKGLVGFGWASFNDTFQYDGYPIPTYPARHHGYAGYPGGNPPAGMPSVGEYYFEDDFFIFEPQATAVVRVARGFAIDVSGGYRVISGLGHYNSWLDGASVSVGVRIGPRI